MSNDDDFKASRNAPGHSGRRIPHPLSQTRLPTAAKSNSQEMCEHELSAEPTGLAESTSKQIPVGCKIHFDQNRNQLIFNRFAMAHCVSCGLIPTHRV
jgi:hypothetical protein